jgi:hypothetical protein
VEIIVQYDGIPTLCFGLYVGYFTQLPSIIKEIKADCEAILILQTLNTRIVLNVKGVGSSLQAISLLYGNLCGGPISDESILTHIDRGYRRNSKSPSTLIK